LLVVFLLVQTQAGDVGASREIPAHHARYFRALGHRVRSYRMERKLTQEDMISYGFSVRHWQMVESGRPITLFTLLRICEAFDVAPEQLVEGLARHLRKRARRVDDASVCANQPRAMPSRNAALLVAVCTPKEDTAVDYYSRGGSPPEFHINI